MNLYIVRGEQTDGTYMSWYTEAVTLFADSEEEAIKLADADGELLGKPSTWKVELVVPKKGIFYSSVTRDY